MGDAKEMNCETCKDNQIKYNNSCYDIANTSIKSFYEPESNNNNSTSCFKKFGLYIKEDSNECIPLPKEEEGYFISNNVTGLLSKCHDNCLSCNNGPIKKDSSYSMECIKCKVSNSSEKIMIKMDNNCFYIVKYDGEKIIFNASEIRPDNHLVTCMDFGKVIYYGEYVYECKERLNTYSVLTDKNENTDIIKNSMEISNNSLDNSNNKNTNNILIIKDDSDTKELNTDEFKNEKNIYFKEKTNDYDEVEASNNNYLKNYFNLSNNISCSFGIFDKEKKLNELKNLIRSNIIQYISSCKVFNGSNFIVSVIPSNKIDPVDLIKNGISAFDLGKCTNIIKDHYNISKDENLIIMNIETKNDENKKNENNIGKNTKLEIYDYSGTELNLSICKDDIKIIKYIGDVEKIDLDSAKALLDKGINVFNAADKFFNDICYPFDNPYGKDIIINDRRNDIYQNITFCQDGCTNNGINYDLKVVNCLCNLYTLQKEEKNITYTKKESNEINFDSITKSFIENLFNFNFDIVKCYNLILDTKNLFRYNFNILFLFITSFI